MVRREIITAETDLGRRAIAEVMQHSYTADVQGVPPAWARALLVDGVPVSFILVDPGRRMDHPGGDLRFAFIDDTATREDRRGEGHFRWLMERTFSDLRAAGLPLVVTHGDCRLYRRFGFDVFTHHCGIFVTPEAVERVLGRGDAEDGRQLLTVEEGRYFRPGLLVVSNVGAATLAESRAVLRCAAALARARGKERILFEHPPAPSYGSRYPLHPSLETPFTSLARTCGAEVCVQGAEPEGGTIPHADWIAVLDAARLLEEALQGWGAPPAGAVGFDTAAGVVTVESSGESVRVRAGIVPGAVCVTWPPAALAQLVTGYRPAGVLTAIHGTPLPGLALALLQALFPPGWRLSRNESWTYTT